MNNLTFSNFSLKVSRSEKHFSVKHVFTLFDGRFLQRRVGCPIWASSFLCGSGPISDYVFLFCFSGVFFINSFRFVTLFIRRHSSTSRGGPSRSRCGPVLVLRTYRCCDPDGLQVGFVFWIKFFLNRIRLFSSVWTLEALRSEPVLIRNRFPTQTPVSKLTPFIWIHEWWWTLRPSGRKCWIRTVLEAGSPDGERECENEPELPCSRSRFWWVLAEVLLSS